MNDYARIIRARPDDAAALLCDLLQCGIVDYLEVRDAHQRTEE
jgi:hypothetical protein